MPGITVLFLMQTSPPIPPHPPVGWGGLGSTNALLAGQSTQNTAHEGGGGGKNAHRNICTRTNTQPLCFDILATHTTDLNSTRPPDSHHPPPHLPPCLPPRGELKNTRID